MDDILEGVEEAVVEEDEGEERKKGVEEQPEAHDGHGVCLVLPQVGGDEVAAVVGRRELQLPEPGRVVAVLEY